MSYTPTNWKNGETPINDENLNKIEQGILALESEVGQKFSELKENQIFDDYQDPAFTLRNCTGNISSNVKIAYSSNKGRGFQIGGRIIISNFVRKDGNPGVTLQLPFPATKATPNLCVGYRLQDMNEMVFARVYDNDLNKLYIVTTESYSNPQNGTLTLVIPWTYIYIP